MRRKVIGGVSSVSAFTLLGDITMDSHRILELPAPVDSAEPARKADSDAALAAAAAAQSDVDTHEADTGNPHAVTKTQVGLSAVTNDAQLPLAGGTMTGALVSYAVTGITASTTQTQGQGALTGDLNQVATVANASDTVTLPSVASGKRCIVLNDGANTLKIYPASGHDLGAGTNASTTLAAGGRLTFLGVSTTKWDLQTPAGSTTVTGSLQLTDSIASTSTTTAATPNSVKTAYDLANAALPKAGGTMSGAIAMGDNKLTGLALAQATPGTFAFASSVNLDVSARNDYRQTDTLTGPITITLTNGIDGSQGTVLMEQDSTGRAVTFAASGRTVIVYGTISSTASKSVACGYIFATVNSVARLHIFPSSN